MKTSSHSIKINDDLICQGDIFQDVKYSFIGSDDENELRIVEYSFPYAIILSQSCDITHYCKLVKSLNGKTSKIMMSILMCPIYNIESMKNCEHTSEIVSNLSAFNSKKIDSKIEKDLTSFCTRVREVAENDSHYRFHILNVLDDHKKFELLSNHVIDFKHYFCVPIVYLLSNIDNRICRLDTIFSEQITLKFSNYLSRVGIPDEEK